MRIINSTIACLMLAFMFILMFFSSWNDSATMDELAHIPAGYSYLTQRDYRLNPEHPPLIKDLAAVPLLFLNLKFPTDANAWKNDINGQWDMGRIFLYESGNNADQILHFSRFPIMLLAILFGWLLFEWVRKIYGDKVALLTLFFFSFSPTFIAHSRYVTTDLGAAFGFFIGIVAFVNFLQRQNKKNLVIAGIIFGVAEMLKFSVVLLAPLYVVFGILWVILENYHEPKKIIRESLKMLGKILIIGLIGLILITIVYQFHIWNYPPERQVADTVFILNSFGFRPAANLAVWMADKPVFRALGQYFLGILMVLQRSAGGNTAYFMGDVSSTSWHFYFPFLYFLKEHLAFHIFTLIAIIFSIVNIIKARRGNLVAVLGWCRDNFVLTAGIIFIAVYWAQAISSNLNIGIRHVLPTFPFIYLLVSRQIIRWLRTPNLDNPQTLMEWIKDAIQTLMRSLKKYLVAVILGIWIILATFITFPYYLSYYNELAGGTPYGYKIAADSNYDWGQDLKRLVKFVDDNKIEKIAIDYFGGGNVQYYLGDCSENSHGRVRISRAQSASERFSCAEPWWSSKGQPAAGSWFAISATFRQGAFAKPVKNFIQNPEDTYSWLKDKTPVARAGTSIFIYKF
jgi:4-amino-4-deoxy-L-arabinose transferase-like glycosyltransferase